MTSTMLLWPPPTCENKYDGQRVDLLELIPPNRFDDFSPPDREQHVAGVILRADRVIMDRERYPDCERSTQHKLSDDIQASCREQGHCISVKEWADKNQHRGTLRLRLRCRSSACRFQFQLNWDSKAGFWYISRRRCGTFVHTCQPVKTSDPSNAATVHKRRLLEPKGPSSSPKRARLNEGSPKTSNKEETKDSGNTKTQGGSEAAVLDALDSARSLLDLSRAPSSPGAVSPTNEEKQKPQQKSPQPSPMPSAPEYIPVRLGDRFFLHPVHGAHRPSDLSLLAAPAPAGLSTQQKLAILRGGMNDSLLGRVDLCGSNNLSPAIKAALQQRCMAFPALGAPAPAGQTLLHHQADPRLLRTGLLLNGNAYANL